MTSGQSLNLRMDTTTFFMNVSVLIQKECVHERCCDQLRPADGGPGWVCVCV